MNNLFNNLNKPVALETPARNVAIKATKQTRLAFSPNVLTPRAIVLGMGESHGPRVNLGTSVGEMVTPILSAKNKVSRLTQLLEAPQRNLHNEDFSEDHLEPNRLFGGGVAEDAPEFTEAPGWNEEPVEKKTETETETDTETEEEDSEEEAGERNESHSEGGKFYSFDHETSKAEWANEVTRFSELFNKSECSPALRFAMKAMYVKLSLGINSAMSFNMLITVTKILLSELGLPKNATENIKEFRLMRKRLKGLPCKIYRRS
eukprot:Nk52_evm15s179 gene=Nk52_evmTU15s179